jgi:hypothetical protein
MPEVTRNEKISALLLEFAALCRPDATDLESPDLEVDELGIIQGTPKWRGNHWSSCLFWTLHLRQALSGVKEWSHVSLGSWILFPVDADTCRACGLAPIVGQWIEIQERDNGTMNTEYWAGAEAKARIIELDDLCHGGE